MEPATKTSPRPVGADIEIIDRHSGDLGALLPSAIRINGVEIIMPADAVITIHDLTPNELVTVTVTLFAKRVTIAAEADI